MNLMPSVRHWALINRSSGSIIPPGESTGKSDRQDGAWFAYFAVDNPCPMPRGSRPSFLPRRRCKGGGAGCAGRPSNPPEGGTPNSERRSWKPTPCFASSLLFVVHQDGVRSTPYRCRRGRVGIHASTLPRSPYRPGRSGGIMPRCAALEWGIVGRRKNKNV